MLTRSPPPLPLLNVNWTWNLIVTPAAPLPIPFLDGSLSISFIAATPTH